MKNKLFVLINTVLFLAFIMVFCFLSILGSEESFSKIENRELAAMPGFTISRYLDATFIEDFQKYYDDTFPYREAFLLAARPVNSFYNSDFFGKFYSPLYAPVYMESNNTAAAETQAEVQESDMPSTEPVAANQAVEQALPSEQAVKADEPLVKPSFTNDKYVIYKDMAMGRFVFDENNAAKYADAVNEIYIQSGMPNTYVLTPISAYELYYPNVYKDEKVGEKQAREFLAEKLNGPKLIDTYTIYTEKKDEYICFKTDHHWTPLGAYYGYTALLEEMGETPLPLEEYETFVRNEFLGYYYQVFFSSSYGKDMEKAPDSVVHYIPKHSAEVFVLNNGKAMQEATPVLNEEFPGTYTLYETWIPLGHIKSTVGNGKSIMVIRDSFGHLLLPFLIDHFEDIYFVEPRALEKGVLKVSDFIKEHNIDNVVYLNFPMTVMGSGWDKWWEVLENIK